MLRIIGERADNCQGQTRRSFVQAGCLGLGGFGLSDWFRLREAQGAVDQRRDTSVILFWLSGGPGHMETYDPKPEAVDQYRGPFGAVSSAVSGLLMSEMIPEQAKIMDRLAVLRTVNHGSGDHTKGNHWMLTGFEGPSFNAIDFNVQRRPSMGSVVAKLKGLQTSGMPPYVAVPNLRGGTDNFFHYATYLGAGANPFNVESDPNSSEFAVKNLTLQPELSFDRLADRRRVLETLDQFRRDSERSFADREQQYQRAFDLLTSRQVSGAFDINAESAATRDRYGRHTFGQSALLARRMVESGVPFVTVNCVPWDHHGTAGRLRTEEGAKLLIPPLDRAIAALVTDLIDRGLYEKTLVVAMGEFGRTPKMNAEGGRDHWGHTFSVLMGCGSMRMGQAIGRSDERGEYVADRPITPQDVTSTVFHHLGIRAEQVSFVDRQGRGLPLVDHGAPIAELL